MVINKVHGIHATSMSMSERFTILTSFAPRGRVRRGPVAAVAPGNLFYQHMNARNRNLVEMFARQLQQQQAKRKNLRQRLGVTPGALRRFGSETSLVGLRRANSVGNLSQGSFKNRVGWRGSNGNLSRAGSFSDLAQAQAARGWLRPGFFNRGRVNRPVRGRFRRLTQVNNNNNSLAAAGPGARGARRGAGRGHMRGRGRGGIRRQQPVPTRDELDTQLDQYMASSKNTLDKELEEYMKEMETE